MKISYSNYPILEKIYKCSLGKGFDCFEDDRKWIENNIELFASSFIYCSKLCNHTINVVSSTFYDAAFKAYDKLDKLLVEILNDDSLPLDISGVFVLPQTVILIDFHKKNTDQYYALMVFQKTGEPVMLSIVAASENIDDGISWVSNTWAENKEEVRPLSVAQFHMASILYMFKQYAEVEIKMLAPGQHLKDINCKYINDTKSSLTYLDSKWFTTLVKSDAFKVRGHFRLQPKKKDGEWVRELIWIDDFMKSGYTSPARKLGIED